MEEFAKEGTLPGKVRYMVWLGSWQLRVNRFPRIGGGDSILGQTSRGNSDWAGKNSEVEPLANGWGFN